MFVKNASDKIDTDNNYYSGEIGVLHDVVHQGKMHAVSYAEEDVAAGGTLRMLIKAGSLKDVHMRLNYGAEGKAQLKTYTGVTYTGGTVYTPFNRQTALGNVLESEYIINPTITDFGTPRSYEHIGADGVLTAIGGASSNDLETVINADTDLLIEITNRSGAVTGYLQIVGAVYERSRFIE